ncbi:Nucleosomal histone H3-Lys79 methylase [Phlyctochytrium planicorne]|nr:Nucleosomal histone H3-Lys79 methylase [Phlyctochytrium planicorne]
MLYRFEAPPKRPPHRYVYYRIKVPEDDSQVEKHGDGEERASNGQENDNNADESPSISRCIQSKDIVLPNAKFYRPRSYIYNLLMILRLIILKLGVICVWNILYLERLKSKAFLMAEPSRKDEYNPIADLKVVATYIATECVEPSFSSRFGDVNNGLLRQIIKACNRRNVKDLEACVSQFNSAIEEYRSSRMDVDVAKPPASIELIDFILDQAYARAVSPNVSILKSYKGIAHLGTISPLTCFVTGFSNFVYGEVKHKFVCDLGSGVGTVVLQVAAQTLCEAHGIEVMDNPAKLAERQREDYAFNAELNQGLLTKFLDLKDTAKVI